MFLTVTREARYSSDSELKPILSGMNLEQECRASCCADVGGERLKIAHGFPRPNDFPCDLSTSPHTRNEHFGVRTRNQRRVVALLDPEILHAKTGVRARCKGAAALENW